MNERLTVAAGLLLAVLANAAVGVLTGSPAVFAATPVGVAVYLWVGVGAPQFLLARQTGADLRLGVAALAAAGGACALLAGRALGGLHRAWGVPFVGLLVLVVAGVLLGMAATAFREGYRSGA